MAQSAFTKAGRTLFEKLPAAKRARFINEALQDPALMADLLRRPTSAQAAKNTLDSLQEKMQRLGYIPVGPWISAMAQESKEQPNAQETP